MPRWSNWKDTRPDKTTDSRFKPWL